MKHIFLLALAILALATSCQKEDVTEFTDYDKNWFVIEDNSSDSVQHAEYEFYKDFDVPVFINDTIGSQQRVDMWGNEYTHYETLTLAYSMGGNASAYSGPSMSSYSYCDKSVVPAALRWLRENVMPLVPKNTHIHSFFLVESFYSQAFGSYAFKGVNAVVIGNASRLGKMSRTETKTCVAAILRAVLTDKLFNKGLFDEQMASFKAVATNQNENAYNLYTGGKWVQDANGNWIQEKPDIYALGFIGTSASNSYYTPSDEQTDFLMYFEKLLVVSEEEFDATLSSDGHSFSSYPAIMQKKAIVIDILKQLGLK